MLEGVDAFIYLGDYCNLAGMDSNWYGGCNPKGIHEIRLLYDFMRAVYRVGVPSLFIAGNHDPEANYMPWKFPNWGVFHRPARSAWCGLDIQIYPTGYWYYQPIPLAVEGVDILLSHEPISNYTHYSPRLYAHGHIHTRGGYNTKDYLNAACGNYIVEL
jgi:DNA repair exonuclease SbcCD nuclease subunit